MCFCAAAARRQCALTGKVANNGYTVTFSHKRNKKLQGVNLQEKKVFWPAKQRWVTLKICTRVSHCGLRHHALLTPQNGDAAIGAAAPGMRAVGSAAAGEFSCSGHGVSQLDFPLCSWVAVSLRKRMGKALAPLAMARRNLL